MKENQTSWESRNQQVNFGMHIVDLLRIQFGRIFSSQYQGGGEIADLVITGHDISPKKMEEMRNFLIKSYCLDLHKINGHGHVAGTIVIHISEMTNNSRKKIEDEFHLKVILPKSIENKKLCSQKLIKKPLSILSSSAKIEEPEVIAKEIEIVETQIKNQEIMENGKFNIIKKGRQVFSMFLIALFKFEGIMFSAKENVFSFDENKAEDCQTINFRNEAEASIANQALTWLYGDAKMLPALDRNYIMIDFFYFNFNKRFSPNITFCLAPIQGDSIERIEKRAIRVLTGYNLSLVKIIDEESFSLCYSRQATTQKFLELILGMGWEAYMQNDIIICKFRPKPEVAEEIATIISTTPKVEEIIPVSEPDKKVSTLGNSKNEIVPKKISEQEPKPTPIISKIGNDVIIIPEDKKEVLADLQFLYADKRLFSRLPAEMQKEVIYTIRMNYMEEHTEDYAKSLLAFLKK